MLMVIREEIKNLPGKPGVYLMKDKKARILYIGKAISLKKRVRSYFGRISDQNPKLESLVPQIQHIDYIVTSSELEALILENTLIKKHRPKYNVVLRDDKNYPYLCLTISEKYPRLVVTRKVRKNQNMYFGPYIPANAMKRTLKTIYQLFPLRQLIYNLLKRLLLESCLPFELLYPLADRYQSITDSGTYQVGPLQMPAGPANTQGPHLLMYNLQVGYNSHFFVERYPFLHLLLKVRQFAFGQVE